MTPLPWSGLSCLFCRNGTVKLMLLMEITSLLTNVFCWAAWSAFFHRMSWPPFSFPPGCYSGSAVSGIMLILVSYLVRGVLCLGEPMPQGCKDCLVVQRCRFFILATFFSHNTETKPKLTDTRVLDSFMST